MVVLHVLDSTVGEIEWMTLTWLLDRLSEGEPQQVLVAVDAPTARRARARLRPTVRTVIERRLFGLPAGLTLRRACRDVDASLVHAWGLSALAAAAAAIKERPLIVSAPATDSASVAARWLRSLPTARAVVVSSQTRRRALVEAGVEPSRVVVIRGGVDFAAINEARQRNLRRELVGDAQPVLLAPGPASRAGGQYQAVWAAAILRFLFPALKIVVPYHSAETRRLRRFVEVIGLGPMLVTPGDRFRWPELAAAADVMIASPTDEMATEPLAWAMAAGIAIVGAARRSVAELIADRSNGLLCRSNAPRLLASAALRLIDDADLRRRLVDAASGQAFEVFSVRTMVDNYAALYANVAAGRAPDRDVRDAAMVA